MSELIDTHCHIQSIGDNPGDFTAKKWRDGGITDPGVVVQEAADAGVGTLICVGTDVEDSINAVRFVKNRPNCFASVGVHPHEAKQHKPEDAARRLEPLVQKAQNANKIVAIGECGLDYHYEHSPRQEQIILLEQLLEVAHKNNLPVIFHVREAFEDFWPVIDNFKGIDGVLHSFSATTKELEQGLARGLYVGFNGIMTFTKDNAQLKAAKAAPADKILLETDAPYLAPSPFRGQVCKPEHVKATAEFLSGLRKETLEEITFNTTNNAKKLFIL
jgi:TatD DNase family protein